MDKHDFYKEIMSRYAIDEEKIRRNAKRAPSRSFVSRNAKWLPLTTAAAVFAAVYGGYIFFSSDSGDGGIIAPAHISYEERVKDMILHEKLITGGYIGESEVRNMYVSFTESLTYKEFDSVLSLAVSDTGGVRIIALWNGRFTDAETAKKSSPEAFYDGAKIEAPDELYLKLKECPKFAAIDIEGKVNDENFEPIATAPQPAQTTVPVVIVTQPPVAATSVSDISGSPAVTTSEVSASTSWNAELTITPDETTENVTDDPVEIVMLNITVDNAVSVEFISENKFILLTRNQVLLYEIINNDGKRSYEISSSFEAANPKITYTDFSTGSLIILGGDAYGRQTNLFLADAASGELIKLDTAVITQNFSVDISYAFYSGGGIILKAQNANYNAIYAAKKSDGYYFERLEESSDKLIILNYTGGGFMYARVSDDAESGGTRIYKYNLSSYSTEEIDLGLSGELSFERSPDVKKFAVISNGVSYIWSTEQNALIEGRAASSPIKFHQYSGDVFTDGESWYLLVGDGMLEITDREADQTAQKPYFSSDYRLYDISPSAVKIEVITAANSP